MSTAESLPADSRHIGRNNFQRFGLDVHYPVFPIAAILVIVFAAITLLYPDAAAEHFVALRSWLTTRLDWVFMISANVFVLTCIAIIVSPWGKIKLGGTAAQPEFSTLSWFSMLFAAGIGIGLMFYGVYEPVNHFLTPALGVSADDAVAARKLAMAASILHWTLHPWAIYAVVALSLAFFSYNRGLPLSIRSAFYPLLGERVWGWAGHAIDILAVFATLFGLATSLGYGAQQSTAGLHHLFGIPASVTTEVIVIVLITLVALGSVLRGIHGGVMRLSQINMVLAATLCLFVLLVGPTLAIVSRFFVNTLDYLRYLPALSNWLGREDSYFLHGWTTFYWAWWIAWSPFVGMFIARVSRGRSVRQFLAGTLVVPSLIGIAWMTIFGDSAIAQYLNDGYTGVTQTIQNQAPEMALFSFLEALPFARISSTVAVVLILVFFITSMDSGALVIDTITAGGKLNTPKPQRIFWCSFVGLVAIALMIGGGLASLQALTLATAFPFCGVLLAMCVSTIQGLREELHGA